MQPSWTGQRHAAAPAAGSLSVRRLCCTDRMRRQEFDERAELGRANVEAIELTRRHCRRARIEFVGGNSMVGAMLGLPMGSLEVRCEHAQSPRTQGHQALELAIEFYQDNCIACPHRDPTGELPSLATVAGERANAEAARKEAARRAAEERAQRYRLRLERRHQLLAGEGYVVRDLADAIDRIDRADPRTGAPATEEAQAARQILDAARGAPELFRPILVDSLLELAADTTDATAFEALRVLVKSGHCPPRRALETAQAVLRRYRSVDAGRLLAVLGPDLRLEDLPDVLDQLISLASGEDGDLAPVPWRQPSSPEGLIAASNVDLPAVTERIIAHLASGDDSVREAGADAARVLLALDATRVVALGQPLAASVRGPDTGYAGYPHPASAALAALAEAWRGEPELTCQIVETQASGASQEERGELARVPGFVQRFRGPWDAPAPATSEAVKFTVRRAAGDWGDEAADHAADHLTSLVREIPEAVAAHAGGMLGAILQLCSPDTDAPPAAPETGEAAMVAALDHASLGIRRAARLRDLAEAVGRCARVQPESVLASVQELFSATTGNEHHDQAVRVTMLDVLKAAVSPETLRDILPVTYTALLHTDQAVRAGGVDLWAACAAVADSLPAELSELAVPLLKDTYVIVHKRMLDQLPRLSLPADMAPKLLPIVLGWMRTYADKPDPDVLERAIWALYSLASDLGDPSQATAWYGVALAHVDQCRPHDRERLLTAWWPDELRDHPAWTKAALATAADPELIDYYNQRHEPLLQEFMDRPRLITDVPLADIEPLCTVHGPAHYWRALETVELLQSAGRWADATEIARGVEARQPPGEEGARGRHLARAIIRGAELAQALAAGPPPAADLADRTSVATEAVTAIETSFPEGVRDGQIRSTLDGLRASATAPALLLVRAATDPASVADELDQAAELLLSTPSAHASGTQRAWIAKAWQIAAVLFRYDAAARAVAEDAPALLQAAKRNAQVLSTEILATEGAAEHRGLIAFLTAVDEVADPGAAQAACEGLAKVPPPVSLIGTSLLPQWRPIPPEPEPEEGPRAVCVATMRGVPVTDILVVRPHELYTLGMAVRLVSAPEWAERCVVEPVTTLGRDALALPRYEFLLRDGATDDFGITLAAEGPFHCAVEQPILGPAVDCPIQVRLAGNGQEQVIEVAGFHRLQLRPFDPSRDKLTEHEQTSARLLAMFGTLDAPEFDTEDTRAFCRLFAACVRAAQVIMFEKTFMRGSRVYEAEFHNELERLLRADPELGGRLTRRDAVAGGFDDLLHDDVIAELKVSRGTSVTFEHCARYLGQPTQYGVGRGSQLSVLVVFDHGRKEAPPGVIDNYIDWLRPRMHGRDDPRYPSLVGVLIVNTNLPVPSAWSRRRIEVEPLASSENREK